MDIDKIRDQFEASLAALLQKNHPEDRVTVDEIRALRGGVEYKSSMMSMAWWAWQESRNHD